MISMKLIEMRKKVKEETSHIPKTNEAQGILRMYYGTLRMHSLGKKATIPNDKNEVLKIAIQKTKEYAKEEGIKFIPEYDGKFFKI
ncbi:hypothetical protein ES703_102532 [subsurface metagenome]